MPHHYRTRSKTRAGTSSEKMESKRIANDALDALNNIPSSIIEHILCLVPIKDAVRTSILSRDWRYGWAKIPKLEFELEDMVDEDQLGKQLFADWSNQKINLMITCKQFFAIHQVLLKMVEPDDPCVEIEQIITHLARTNYNVKKFKLMIRKKNLHRYSRYELPKSIFLLRNLTDLHIENCTLDHLVPTLDIFRSLTSLFFLSGSFSEKPLLHLLANCPLLKKLELFLDLDGISHFINIFELFKCLPMIEDFSISQWVLRFQRSEIPLDLSIALVHLKRFSFSDMMLLDTYGLEFLFLVIRCSPNLEKIELQIDNYEYHYFKDDEDSEMRSDALKDDIWLEHLTELEIRHFANLEHEMKFVKLILDKAPVLKKVSIYLCECIRRREELKIVRNVSDARRVSRIAEIIVKSLHRK